MKIQEQIDEINKQLGELKERLDAKTVPEPAIKPEQVEPEKVEVILDGPSEPVPSPYRLAVDQILNKEFGIHIKSDGGNFRFAILVPEKYSPLSPEQRKMVGVDMRPKMISNAEGENGVRLWCERVFGNFNPAVQAQIVNDRTLAM